MAGVERHGIDAAAFAALMEDVGFENVVVSVGWTMEKEVERSPGEWGGVEGRGGGGVRGEGMVGVLERWSGGGQEWGAGSR
ncbi:hypothetical protein FH972_022764 [Carpinus fangiana]|uniref:Uncharacterized protein n=1 Tax=Carpinus fangiana TaxID=176857 RepID=A0A5N6KT73_9ROSI|nr:hypothetical protein FH972_022764 [Carpinus fangiana]